MRMHSAPRATGSPDKIKNSSPENPSKTTPSARALRAGAAPARNAPPPNRGLFFLNQIDLPAHRPTPTRPHRISQNPTPNRGFRTPSSHPDPPRAKRTHSTPPPPRCAKFPNEPTAVARSAETNRPKCPTMSQNAPLQNSRQRGICAAAAILPFAFCPLPSVLPSAQKKAPPTQGRSKEERETRVTRRSSRGTPRRVVGF
jgi:hypothetical protein